MIRITVLFATIASAAVLAGNSTGGEQASPSPQASTKPADVREARFAESLSGTVLEGSWRMCETGPGKEAQELGEPRVERYHILKAEKSTDDYWIITARIQYAERDTTLPVPVRVVWAENTPVITLDDMKLPMLGTYSARVMIHEGFYSGIWSGGGHAGVMSGRIVKAEEWAERQSDEPESDQR